MNLIREIRSKLFPLREKSSVSLLYKRRIIKLKFGGRKKLGSLGTLDSNRADLILAGNINRRR